jgi:hypothetical protein
LIDVQSEFPEAEAHRVEGQREVLAESLSRLARLAQAGG